MQVNGWTGPAPSPPSQPNSRGKRFDLPRGVSSRSYLRCYSRYLERKRESIRNFGIVYLMEMYRTFCMPSTSVSFFCYRPPGFS